MKKSKLFRRLSMLLLVCALLLPAFTGRAQYIPTAILVGNTVPTNYVFLSQPREVPLTLYSISGYNTSATVTNYLQFFDFVGITNGVVTNYAGTVVRYTYAVPTNGAIPRVVLPLPPLQFATFAIASGQGVGFSAGTICSSTTPTNLTLGAATVAMQAVIASPSGQ
jgi:hypothetical protein